MKSATFFISEPYVVAFVETVYSVMESKGQVEVCVNLTHPPVDIHNVTVLVEIYNIPVNAVLASKIFFIFVTQN